MDEQWRVETAAATTTVRRKDRERSFNEMETYSYRQAGHSGHGPTAGKKDEIHILGNRSAC